MGKSQRTKGHQWERNVAISLRSIDPSARRNVTECQSGDGYDIELDNLPFTIQCKCGKNVRWIEALMEATKASSKDDMPVAAIKVDRKGEFALMHWKDFIELCENWLK